MEIVQKIRDHIAGRRNEIIVPRITVAVDRRRATGIREEARGEPNVLHFFKRRAGNVAAIDAAGAAEM